MTTACTAQRGVILMAVCEHTLRFAAEQHPQLWDGISPSSTPVIKITDLNVFAAEVARAINDEAEDGSTLLTRMLDAAIVQAVNNGCEGVDHDS